MSFRLVFFGLLLIVSPLYGQDAGIDFTEEEKNYIKNNPVVKYAYDPFWKPIEFAENGEHTGISRDYINIISEKIGIKLVPHPEVDSWSKSVELIKSGEVQFLSCVGDNEERRKFLIFSETYQTHPAVIVTAKDGEFIGSIEDLAGRKVAAPKGYFLTGLLEQEPFEIDLLYTENIEDAFMQITLGNAEAAVSNLATVSHYLNYHGFENLKIGAPSTYPDMEAKIGVRKEQPILRSILDKGLAAITDKEKNEIIQNWVSVKYDHGVNMAKVWTIAGVSIVIVGCIFGFFVYWNRKLKKEVSRRKEAEEQLQESFEEITTQKHLIEEKNEEVMDSIKYAKRIQQAILPTLDRINANIPNNFVFYEPKDIVAGDFYWMETLELSEAEKLIFIAAADCTGHGVPGAMVSVICSNALNKCVLEYNLSDPGEILDKTTDLVIDRFSRADEEVKDGMDIGLSSIRFIEGNKAKINFAGAHNHLWVVTNRPDLGVESSITESEGSDLYLHEIKASKQPVGKFYKRQPFETKSVELEQGERFFLYSDGYADQFGGENGKKFKNKTFKKLIIKTMKEDITTQGSVLKEKFVDWKGDFEQLDDVCVIGVEI